ncbi:hypothetical protein GCM10027160_02960 [Streptomyces calidiresistens]
MDVTALPEAASLWVFEESAVENDITVADVWGYLIHGEWEVVLELPEDFGDAQPLPLGFREALATAEQMRLKKGAARCRRRGYEIGDGIIRYRPHPSTDRRSAPENTRLRCRRPMWNIGSRTPAVESAFDIAVIRVEVTSFLDPVARASVWLAPGPAQWQRLRPRAGDRDARGPVRGEGRGRPGGSMPRGRSHGMQVGTTGSCHSCGEVPGRGCRSCPGRPVEAVLAGGLRQGPGGPAGSGIHGRGSGAVGRARVWVWVWVWVVPGGTGADVLLGAGVPGAGV